MIQKWKTVQQIAEITGYKTRTICDACQRGAIKAEKVNGRWMVDTQSALEFGKQKPHADHTRNRQEKLEEAHEGGLDLKCDFNKTELDKPAEPLKALEDGFMTDYTPELVIADEMDPGIKALLTTAYELIGAAMELVLKAGKRAAELDTDITTEVQA